MATIKYEELVFSDKNEEEGRRYLALWVLQEDGCWRCMDVQVRLFCFVHTNLILYLFFSCYFKITAKKKSMMYHSCLCPQLNDCSG